MKKSKLPKSFTTVTTFSKYLALSMLIILPILAFYYGVYYEQQTRNGLPNPFCKEWKTVCGPNYTDPNGGCTPMRVCNDSPKAFVCPEEKFVNCMPPVNSDKNYCQSDFIDWAEKNCPDFSVAW